MMETNMNICCPRALRGVHRRRAAGLLAAFLIAMAGATTAEVPGQFHYQGRLVVAEEAVSGEVAVTFRLLDAASGGTLLYEEQRAVTVVDGFYSTYIGAATPITPAVFRDNPMIYLEIAVDGQTLSPRERIVSVGYALSAQYAAEAQVAHRLLEQPGAAVIEEPGGEPAPLHVGSTTNVAFCVNMNSITQMIMPGVETKIDWQATEYDTAGAVVLGTDRFVAPVDGYYRLTAQVYASPAVLRTLTKHDQKLARVQLRHNGDKISSVVHRTSGKGSFSLLTTRDRFLSSGDYVEVYMLQNASADVNLLAGGDIWLSYFSGFLIQQ